MIDKSKRVLYVLSLKNLCLHINMTVREICLNFLQNIIDKILPTVAAIISKCCGIMNVKGQVETLQFS